ncbi:LysE family translocator [Epibacterium ulvae]|uniref:LysE family translocator n=1 Tax=Epibacterium ulvae TaxID=1156985 RepID=UPI002490F7EA|nr:LysE family translocator [Epibacterium ulvae]
MTLSMWIYFTAVSVVNIITPGPANLNTVQRALQLGAARVFPTILGNTVGLAIGGFFCASGAAAVLLTTDGYFALWSYLGIAYLVWLAVKLLLSRESIVLDQQSFEVVSAKSLFMEAIVLAVSNPKALLFYIALFPQVLNFDKPIWPQASILVVTYCLLSILSLSSYAGLADRMRIYFADPIRYTRFRQLSGTILLVFCITLALEL